MIRDKTSDVEVLTNMGSDRLKMQIDPDGMVHITDLLTNMYSDEELAVLREYSTNAWDSHVAAHLSRIRDAETMLTLTRKRGGDTMAAETELEAAKAAVVPPIEVTLPCGPYEMPTEARGRVLKIQDYGTGLSTEEIAEVFSFYGKSTKDKSNDFTGMMGIGGKSGLVNTFGSFTMTAVKDGQKTVVHVGRDEATEPVMDLVSVTETDEPNGVLVELPAPKHNRLARKAANFFQFWPKGTVLVDGKEPERLKPLIEVSKDMWIVEEIGSRNNRSDWIVMGNVPYAIELDAKLADGYSLVVYVPMGSVTVAPSREALRMAPETKDEIARIMAEYDRSVKTVMQDKVNAAKSKAEAVRIALEWRKSFASKADFTVTYGKQTIPTYFELGLRTTTQRCRKPGAIIVSRHGEDTLSRHDRLEKIFIGTLVDSVLVHGFNVGGYFTAVHKRKLKAWAAENGITPKNYVLTEQKIAHGWIDSSMRVDWETVKKIKLNTVQGKDGAPRIRGSFDMWIAGKWLEGKPASEIPTGKLFYCDPDYLTYSPRRGYYSRYQAKAIEEKRGMLFKRYPDATFVEVPHSRLDKFKRDFPHAERASSILTEIWDEYKKRIKRADMIRIVIDDDYNSHIFGKLDINRVDDPKIKTAIRQYRRKLNRDLTKEIRAMARACDKEHDPIFKLTWKNPLDDYPLASIDHLEHTYTYLNAVYAAKVNNK